MPEPSSSAAHAESPLAPAGDVRVHLAEALTRELGPGERVLWMGTPGVRAYVVNSDLGVSLFAAFFFAVFGGAVAYAATLNYADRGNTIDVVDMGFFILGSVVAIVSVLATILLPIELTRRARYTVYAVTSERVLELRLSRRNLPRMKSVALAHPLEVARRDSGPDRGTVMLYPRQQGKLVLRGIRNPRAAEHALRTAAK